MSDDRGDHAPMTSNQVVSARDALGHVLKTLEHRRHEIEPILPPDQPWDAFHATINQALRANPDLLSCEPRSLVNACIKAAYDGLRIDGKEAAITFDMVTPKNGGRKVKTARYMPMVFGLIKQILRSGAALTVKAVIVYKNEISAINPVNGKPHFMLLEGTTPGIHHSPMLLGDKGDMIGCYAVAEVQRGVFKFEWMDRAQITDVQREAKTDKVWTRWPTEMWKKTVIRRLRKSLSGTSEIRDAEAMEMFAQFDRTSAHPQMASAAPRPTRAALADQSGTTAGVDADFGGLGREEESVEREQQDEPRSARDEQRREGKLAEERGQNEDQPAVELPEDDAAWARWAADVEQKVAVAGDAAAVDAVWTSTREVAQHAPKAVLDRLTAAITNRNTELALGDE